MNKTVTVIGAGLAGSECAYQLAERGYKVKLIEAKPITRSPAHSSNNYCEIVCSNSLKSDEPGTASGLLKEELRQLNSMVLSCAYSHKVPAGGALAVEREGFSLAVTEKLRNHKNITIENFVAENFNEAPTVIATGPLTLAPLDEKIKESLGTFHFYDAAAPIIDGESIDYSLAFIADRYEKGTSDYVNCPLSKDEYYAMIEALTSAETAEKKDFEKKEIFEGCMPVEIMAGRGKDTLRFGPLKPVGIIDPRTGKRPFAVVQLRKENCLGTMFNLVGFQTNLKFGEQKKVFTMIPALKNAEFLRYGVMHRNSYIDAPAVLTSGFQVKTNKNLFVAGQLSGVEGYVESIASGLMAAINMAAYLEGREPIVLPETTIIGSLSRYISTPNVNFQPMNANFGTLPPLSEKVKDKKDRKLAHFERGKADLIEFVKNNEILKI